MEDEVKIIKKKKVQYSPYKVSVIIIIGLFIMIIMLNMYFNKTMRYEWLICDYNSETKEFDETLKFKFQEKDDKKLLEYYRYETYIYEKEDEYDAIYEHLIDYKDSLGDYFSGDNIKYAIKKASDKEIDVETYINVNTYSTIFDSYMEAFDLDHESDIEDVYNTLAANQAYSCTVVETR